MNYFDNKLFSLGFTVVMVAGGASVLSDNSWIEIIGAIAACVGLIIMFVGIRQLNNEEDQ